MFELPSLEGVSEVVVNEDTIDRESDPLLIYVDKSEEPASAS